MSKKFYGDIELLGGSTIINLAAETFENDPTFDETESGRIIYNSTENAYKYNNGSAWVTFEVSTTSSNALVETLGSNWINGDFSFDPTPFNTLDNLDGLVTTDSLFTVIAQLDVGISVAKSVVTLQGVPLNFNPVDLEPKNIIYFDGSDFVLGTINDLDTITLNLSELDDVTLLTVENNESLVFQNGNWANKKTRHQFQDLSGTVSTFVVTHDLGTQFCNVEVIDMSAATPIRMNPAEIISIAYSSTTELTVTILNNKPVTILVNGLEIV